MEKKRQWLVRTPIGMLYGPFLSATQAGAWADKEMAGGNWCVVQLHFPSITAKAKGKAQITRKVTPQKVTEGGYQIKGGRVITSESAKGVPYLIKKPKGVDEIRVRGWQYRWSAKHNGYIFI